MEYINRVGDATELTDLTSNFAIWSCLSLASALKQYCECFWIKISVFYCDGDGNGEPMAEEDRMLRPLGCCVNSHLLRKRFMARRLTPDTVKMVHNKQLLAVHHQAPTTGHVSYRLAICS